MRGVFSLIYRVVYNICTKSEKYLFKLIKQLFTLTTVVPDKQKTPCHMLGMIDRN